MGLKMNKVMLLGRLGRDPEMRTTAGGQAVANFSVATDEGYKNKETNEWVDRVEWHNCVAWGKTAEYIGAKLGKGRIVQVEGKLQTRKWQDKEGADRYSTEIVVESIVADTAAKGDGGTYTPKPQSERTQDGTYEQRETANAKMDNAPF